MSEKYFERDNPSLFKEKYPNGRPSTHTIEQAAEELDELKRQYNREAIYRGVAWGVLILIAISHFSI